jgi:hypothetical protein
MGGRLIVLDKLNELSPRGKALLLAAIVVLTPLAGWLGYQFGFMLGSH